MLAVPNFKDLTLCLILDNYGVKFPPCEKEFVIDVQNWFNKNYSFISGKGKKKISIPVPTCITKLKLSGPRLYFIVSDFEFLDKPQLQNLSHLTIEAKKFIEFNTTYLPKPTLKIKNLLKLEYLDVVGNKFDSAIDFSLCKRLKNIRFT